ncbi:YlzJ-like family protein [Salipaludibacillus aurantiacus]|uniref:YlzJ-like protein n=1 Tax=Salipaludibacillus aurantiacus TaxID=1601833 RepID=A0A1H9QHX8_9BACI|nr:YlzJ-like family protein [Salipaludibacillus aurantiacus]SER59459.1 YlzJ-like protein [Salipaludibacillus aurantiacus]
MILYTYQSSHTVFPPEEQDFTSYEMLEIPGGQLMCEKNGEDYIICRLLATDPNMYLNPKYTPGQKFKP